MKKYDYIFHPHPQASGEWIVQGMDIEDECVERKQGPLICLTIEELRKVWDQAYKCGRADGGRNIDNAAAVNFTSYFNSEGINI